MNGRKGKRGSESGMIPELLGLSVDVNLLLRLERLEDRGSRLHLRCLTDHLKIVVIYIKRDNLCETLGTMPST